MKVSFVVPKKLEDRARSHVREWNELRGMEDCPSYNPNQALSIKSLGWGTVLEYEGERNPFVQDGAYDAVLKLFGSREAADRAVWGYESPYSEHMGWWETAAQWMARASIEDARGFLLDCVEKWGLVPTSINENADGQEVIGFPTFAMEVGYDRLLELGYINDEAHKTLILAVKAGLDATFMKVAFRALIMWGQQSSFMDDARRAAQAALRDKRAELAALEALAS